MATLKKYDLSGKMTAEVTVEEEFANASAHGQMVKDYIVALRNNARQWSASTKGRSEVNHTTKKPHPQKGGGRARQGSLAAPQYKGGGRVFGPKPKVDQHVRINKKERRAAILFLLSEKIREGKLLLVEDFKLDKPATKSVAAFMKNCQLEGRVLFLGEGSYSELVDGNGYTKKVSSTSNQHDHFIKSMRNLPKAEFSLALNASGYSVAVARHVVMTQAAFDELAELLLP